MSLNHTFGVVAHDVFHVSPLSKQQVDGTENDALSCTRFSGNDRETIVESDVERVNQGEILDV